MSTSLTPDGIKAIGDIVIPKRFWDLFDVADALKRRERNRAKRLRKQRRR